MVEVVCVRQPEPADHVVYVHLESKRKKRGGKRGEKAVITQAPPRLACLTLIKTMPVKVAGADGNGGTHVDLAHAR